jgi:hypothetical protein
LSHWANSSPLVRPLCISNSKFQFFGIVLSVCINLFVHFFSTTELHGSPQYLTWPTTLISPIYLCTISSSLVPKHTCIFLLHYDQSFIPSLCVSHYMDGVTFITTYSANNLCCSGCINSNSFTNILISFNPSHMDGSHISSPIQCKDWVRHGHHLMEDSCILYFQWSRPYSEFDSHELMLLQLGLPPAVGFT